MTRSAVADAIRAHWLGNPDATIQEVADAYGVSKARAGQLRAQVHGPRPIGGPARVLGETFQVTLVLPASVKARAAAAQVTVPEYVRRVLAEHEAED